MSTYKTYDPQDVKDLRGELLRAGLAIMREDPSVERWSALKKEYILKVGSRCLPVLNAGKDDDSDLIPAPLLGGLTNGLQKDTSTGKTAEDNKKD